MFTPQHVRRCRNSRNIRSNEAYATIFGYATCCKDNRERQGEGMNFRSWTVWVVAAIVTALSGFAAWSVCNEFADEVNREVVGATAQESLIAQMIFSCGVALLVGLVVLLIAAAISGAMARHRRRKLLSI